MNEGRIRELEWAATYLATHEKPRGCRCGGSCDRCRAYREQENQAAADALAMARRRCVPRFGFCALSSGHPGLHGQEGPWRGIPIEADGDDDS